MGRPESRVEAASPAVGEFAGALRDLRTRAGEPTYRQLARACHFSPATLARAASGRQLPSLEVSLAYVGACGGDTEEWRTRWALARAQTRPALDVGGAGPDDRGEAARPAPRWRDRRVVRWALPVVAAVSVAFNVFLVTRLPDTAAASPPSVAAPVQDGTDPKVSGCGTGAVDLAVVPVTLPGPRAIGPRYFAAGTTLGTVTLRWSARCAGAWARFDPAGHTFSDPTEATVTVEAARPSEGTLTSFRLAHVDQAYSDLLLTGVGCVTARAVVTFDDGTTASGETACLPHL